MLLALCLTGCGQSGQSAGETEKEAELTAASESGTESTADLENGTESAGDLTAEEVLAPLGFDVMDYVVLNDYQNMKISDFHATEITEVDIEEQLEMMAAMYPTYYVVGDKQVVEEGDAVNIDYRGYLDGEEFDGGSAQDCLLIVGSAGYVDGFEEGLIGAAVGETREVRVTFPEDYGVASLNGQDVVFRIKINAIEEAVTVTMDTLCDDWVKDNFTDMGCSTLEELRTYLESYLKEGNETLDDNRLQELILKQMLEECEVTLPEGYLEQRIEIYNQSVYEKVEASGQSFEECMGVTEEEYLSSISENMESRLKKELIMAAVTLDMDTVVPESVYDSYISTYVYNYNYDSEEELFAELDGVTELSGEDYAKLSCAEHQAWAKLTSIVKNNQ